jgi:hypothetical protein
MNLPKRHPQSQRPDIRNSARTVYAAFFCCALHFAHLARCAAATFLLAER